jgi:hypothetical protein
MNAARQRRAALKKRLEQWRNSTMPSSSVSTRSSSEVAMPRPAPPADIDLSGTDLTAQLRQSIKLVEEQKKPFKTLTVMVFLKYGSPEIVKIKADQPTAAIMDMQKNVFWSGGDAGDRPWVFFVPPYSIAKIGVINAEK